jgi:chromatin assembly factor 1 subunit B
MQVYDLAWSPTGEYIIAGSTDNTARVFAAVDGKCVYEIAEHSHYVQGVAWDPLNEYIATQSSDRSMHVYRISSKPGGAFEAHAVGRNTRMPQSRSRRHSRTPSAHGGHGTSKPRMFRRESTTSDVDSAVFDSGKDVEDAQSSTSALTSGYTGKDVIIPLTSATSVGSIPSFMFPPPPIEASSRRSSFSGASNPPGPGSPSTFSTNSRYGRSPSPMPALPAIRSLPSASSSAAVLSWSNAKLYGDESWTNFFRRLTFSPDGGLLLTPAGQFEDPAVVPGLTGSPVKMGVMDDNLTPSRGRKGHPSTLSSTPAAVADPLASTSSSSTSSVYIYSRANFARPPIAQLPGHKKASVAVRFSPILYELRPGVTTVAGEEHHEETKGQATPNATLEKGVDGQIDVDVVGPLCGTTEQLISNFRGGSGTSFNSGSSLLMTQRAPTHQPSIVTPSPRPAVLTSGINPSVLSGASPMLSPMDIRPPTPAASKPPTPVILPLAETSAGANVVVPTASIFALPYRMLFAVVTMDTVAIYDTQQAGPVCMLTKLHYDEFTDLTWYVVIDMSLDRADFSI